MSTTTTSKEQLNYLDVAAPDSTKPVQKNAAPSSVPDVQTKSTTPTLSTSSIRNDNHSLHTIYRVEPKDQFVSLGLLSIFINVGLWVFSMFSPLVVPIALFYGWYSVASSLVLLFAVCAALPVPKLHSFRRFLQNSSRYYSRSSINFERLPNKDKDRPCIYTIAPHGIFCMGWGNCYMQDEMTHMTWCFADVLRWAPCFRVLTESTGNPSGASKGPLTKLMREKKTIVIVPGGFEEATIFCHGVDRLYLKKRKGFIKYALEYGYDISPGFSFGEKYTYKNIQGLWNLRLWLSSKGIPGVVAWGLWWCPCLPRQTELHVVFGKPLEFPLVPTPTAEVVDKWHRIYMERVTELYDKYKVQFYGAGAKDLKLEIW